VPDFSYRLHSQEWGFIIDYFVSSSVYIVTLL